MKDQKGMTLLEVLLTLAILSFISVIVWNVLFQGLNFSNTVQTQTLMQQEANTILTALRKTHQTSDYYTIYYSNEPNASFIKIESDTSTFEFNQANFHYELYRVQESGDSIFSAEDTIIPNLTDLLIKVIIRDENNPDLSYTSQTYIAKLRN